MMNNLETVEMHLARYFKDMEELRLGLPNSCDLIDKIKGLQAHTDEQFLRTEGADIVLQVAKTFGEGDLNQGQAISLARLVELTVNLLGLKIQIAGAEDELQEKPHVLH